jgi:hypothetical protein
MGLVLEQNPQNQKARSLINVKRFVEVIRRRSQDKAIEKPSRKDHPFQIKGAKKMVMCIFGRKNTTHKRSGLELEIKSKNCCTINK